MLDYFVAGWAKLMPPYPSDLVAFIDFDNPAGALVPRVGNFTLNNTGTTEVAGYHGKGRQGAAGATGLMANAKILPLGRKSARVKIKTLTDGVLIGDFVNNGAYGINYRITSGKAAMIFVDSSNYSINLAGNAIVTDGKWHDIVFSWDGTTAATGVKIWVDGVLDAQGKAERAQTAAPSSNTAFFNVSPLATTVSFAGIMDEIEIYNTVFNDPSNTKREIRRRD